MPEVHCQECGRSWGDDATFCGACGGPLHGTRLGPTAPAERSTGGGGRRRWLVAVAVAAVVVVGAGAAALTGPSTSDEVAGGDEGVAVPDQEDLQDPDGQQQDRGAPQVTCERGGEPVGCVSWMRRLDSASSVPAMHSWRVVVASDRILARDAETIVALSRASGQVAWRKEFDPEEGSVSSSWVVDGEVLAVRTGQEVRALSLADGDELWAVDDAHVPFPGRDTRLGTLFTVQLEDGEAVLLARDADGTVRWRHRVAEADPARPRPPLPPEVTELGALAFVVRAGAVQDQHLVALDSAEGTERWRRSDSRPLHVSGDVAVVLDVDRDVDERDDGSVSVSESPEAVVGLDVADGTQRWAHEVGQSWEFGIVDDVLVVVEADGLIGVDLATGERLWRRDAAGDEDLVGARIPWGPSVGDHRRVFTFKPQERVVLARDPASGEVLWRTELEQLVGRVSTVDGAILARGNESTVVQLDPATGRVRGTITTESEGRPQFLAHNVLVDPEAGWAVRLALPDP